MFVVGNQIPCLHQHFRAKFSCIKNSRFLQEHPSKGILSCVVSSTKGEISLSSINKRWSDFEVKASVRKNDINSFHGDEATEDESDIGVLILHLRM